MKKTLCVISFSLLVSICFSFSPVFAKDSNVQYYSQPNVYQNEPIDNFIFENSLSTNFSNNTSNKNLVLKLVEFVITAIVGGMIYDGAKQVWSNVSDTQAVINWMNEHYYSTSDYTITITKVVYDNGWWQPEFPNNPFCKMKLQ